MIHPITIDDLMHSLSGIPLVDVRTPAEFEQGHIPGAFNIPLFSNDQRVEVGTTYKQKGREPAILLGFDLVGPKWSGFIREALDIAPKKKIAVHCWRGGMRSGAMAWALNLYGFDVYLLQGGYKRYRKWVLGKFEGSYPLWLVGGMTGSGKTRILHQLAAMDEQVIDLEALAQHQGSSYGTLNRLVQPTQEQFENDLAHRLKVLDPNRKIWVEDESATIGKRMIPRPFWKQMHSAVVFCLQVPLDQRVNALVKDYGSLDKDFLVECTDRIHKRLGPEQTKQAIAAIREHRMEEFIRLVLVYYDKTYRTGLSNRDKTQIIQVDMDGIDPADNAKQLISISQTAAVAANMIT